jgi:hypothetical protein
MEVEDDRGWNRSWEPGQELFSAARRTRGGSSRKLYSSVALAHVPMMLELEGPGSTIVRNQGPERLACDPAQLQARG